MSLFYNLIKSLLYKTIFVKMSLFYNLIESFLYENIFVKMSLFYNLIIILILFSKIKVKN